MIRSALRYIAAPLLGSLGSAVVRAALAESNRADAAELNEARTTGRLEEARRNASKEWECAEGWRLTLIREADRVRELEHEIDTTRSELACAVADNAHLVGEIERAAIAHATLIGQVNVARARIRELDPTADEVPAVESCAWCLGQVDDVDGFSTWTGAPGDSRTWTHLCREHANEPPTRAVRERVATRAASCPSRRTSPDPLAIACSTCGAHVWQTCADRAAYLNSSPF